MKTLIATLSIAAMLAVVTPIGAKDAQRETITLGQVGLSFYAVVGGVVQELLENQGYTVEVVEGPHAEIFPRLGKGEVDMLAAAWLPSGHGALYAPVKAVTFEIAPIYENADFFWVVPSYVPADKVSSIADLARPEVAKRMPDTIVSLPEATGLTAGARRAMETYDLDEAGYKLVAAAPAEWLGRFREAVEAREWVVFPLWQPQWVNAVYDIRPLDDPENAYGDPDTAYLIGHQQLRGKLDTETMNLLSSIRFEIADVTEMDRLMNVEGMSARDAAQTWMNANPETVASWSSR